MISLELKNEEGTFDCAELYIDDEGIQDLENILKFLRERKTDHADIFSKSWGGDAMIGIAHQTTSLPIQYLKIIFTKKFE